jgi:hypothetical protein
MSFKLSRLRNISYVTTRLFYKRDLLFDNRITNPAIKFIHTASKRIDRIK